MTLDMVRSLGIRVGLVPFPESDLKPTTLSDLPALCTLLA
jgi:hypothetical protein